MPDEDSGPPDSGDQGDTVRAVDGAGHEGRRRDLLPAGPSGRTWVRIQPPTPELARHSRTTGKRPVFRAVNELFKLTDQSTVWAGPNRAGAWLCRGGGDAVCARLCAHLAPGRRDDPASPGSTGRWLCRHLPAARPPEPQLLPAGTRGLPGDGATVLTVPTNAQGPGRRERGRPFHGLASSTCQNAEVPEPAAGTEDAL